MSNETFEIDFNLDSIVSVAKSNLKTIIYIFLANFFICIALFYSAKPVYLTEFKLSPADSGSLSSLTDEISKFSSAADFLGVDLPGGNNNSGDKFTEFRLLLDSRKLYDSLAQNEKFINLVFPKDFGVLESVKDFIKWVLRLPTGRNLDGEYAQKIIKGKMSFKFDKKENILSISYLDKNPDRSEIIVKMIYTESEKILKTESKITSEKKIDYFKSKLQELSFVDQKLAISSLLAEEERKLALSSLDIPFSARVFDGPFTSQTPNSPKFLNYLILWIFASILLSILLIFSKKSG